MTTENQDPEGGPALTDEQELDAFNAWAGREYRNAETYTARDLAHGLNAWRAGRAFQPQPAPVALTNEQAMALRPLPFSNAELDRLYANIPPTAQQDARSREAFKRLARVVEAAHDMRAPQTKEHTNDR